MSNLTYLDANQTFNGVYIYSGLIQFVEHSNISSNITSKNSLPLANQFLRGVVLLVYLICFIFGSIGNILVIGIIGYYKSIRIKSVANYYIWNLSVADLLFILTVPFFCYTTYTEHWPFGEEVCKTSFAFRETNRFCSVFILVALSWDRYIASFYQLGHLRTNRLGWIICISIWIICLLMSIPYWIYASTSTKPDNLTTCRFLWPAENRIEYLRIWTYLQLILGLLIPLLLIIIAYILLSLRLQNMFFATRSAVKKPSRKMTRTVIVVVLTFLFCQTPYYAIEIWSLLQQQKVNDHRKIGKFYRPTDIEIIIFPYANAIAKMLVFISSMINPILYGLLNKNYRTMYHIVLCRCQGKATTHRVSNSRDEFHMNSDNSDSEEQKEITPGVTYRFQITFHRPCVGRKRKKRPYSTEHIMMEDKTENKE